MKKSSKITVTINGKTCVVPSGISVLQACELQGIEVPVFCYHKQLSVAGNCRMCLVEVSPGPPKPQACCALTATDGMDIKTDSKLAIEARKNVMELLLINHPLDCPICDQGGECDLQDLALSFGSGRSKYNYDKRSVSEKFMGPFIKTVMTRCIHCTRCIRFASEIAGSDSIGMLGRGEMAEISSLEKTIDSELSGNLIDVCPVGALTSKPYAFLSRPWELEKIAAIGILDAVGSNICLDVRDNKILRVLPRENSKINEVWIDDKTRFHCDALDRMRIITPFLTKNKIDKPRPANWLEVIDYISLILKRTPRHKIGFISGNLVSVEDLFATLCLAQALNVDKFACFADDLYLPPDISKLKFHKPINEIENSDLILIVNANPKKEAPILNARIRKAFLAGASVNLIGYPMELNYQYKHLGDTTQDLIKIFSQERFISKFKLAKQPLIIIGYETFKRSDCLDIIDIIEKFVVKNTNKLPKNNPYSVQVINYLPRSVGFNAACTLLPHYKLGTNISVDNNNMSTNTTVPDINTNYICANQLLREAIDGKLDILYLLASDDIDYKLLEKASKAGVIIIYQGHHGSKISQLADVILPSCCYFEKNSLYLNLEGILQESRQAAVPNPDVKEDWKIIKAISLKLGLNILSENREMCLQQIHNLLAEKSNNIKSQVRQIPTKKNHFTNSNNKFHNINYDYFSNDILARNSQTLIEASEYFNDDSITESLDENNITNINDVTSPANNKA